MKCLTLFVHSSVEHAVVDCLRANERVTGFTLVPCQGHSIATEGDVSLAVQDRVVGYVPRVRIETILEDDILLEVLGKLRECSQGQGSLGFWQVTEVLESGRL